MNKVKPVLMNDYQFRLLISLIRITNENYNKTVGLTELLLKLKK